VIADNSADLTLLQIIQSQLAAVNINMSINLMDTATWTSTVMTGHKADALAFRAGSGALGQTQPRPRSLTASGRAFHTIT